MCGIVFYAYLNLLLEPSEFCPDVSDRSRSAFTIYTPLGSTAAQGPSHRIRIYLHSPTDLSAFADGAIISKRVLLSSLSSGRSLP